MSPGKSGMAKSSHKVLLKFQENGEERGQNGPEHFGTDYIGSPPSLQIYRRRAFS